MSKEEEYSTEYTEKILLGKNKHFKLTVSNDDAYYKSLLSTKSPEEHCQVIKDKLSKYIKSYVEKYGDDNTKCRVNFSISCESDKYKT
jgi:hypothetical protein